MVYQRPFRGEELARRVTPFAVAAGFAFVAIPFPPEAVNTVSLLLAAAANGIVFLTALALLWGSLPRVFDMVPPLVYLLVIAFMRDALGGSNSGYEALVMLPVLWVGLYGTRGQLTAMLVGVSLLFAVPIVASGAPHYSDADWRKMVLWTAVSAVMGTAVQTLVYRVRSLIRTDELTGLLNRTSISIEVSREFVRYRRENDRLQIVMIAIDNLRAFADKHGNRKTDHLIRKAANQWKGGLRATDSIGRYSGNEFLMTLPACSQTHSIDVIERLRSLTPPQCTISTSIHGWDGEMAQDAVVYRAQKALHTARAKGKSQTVLVGGRDEEQ